MIVPEHPVGYWEGIESAQFDELDRLAAYLAEAARPLWHIGDGYGGGVRQHLERAFTEAGLEREPQRSATPAKRTLSALVRRTVLERDAYRCQECGGWADLSIDHVVPEAKGGTDDLDNLQTLCRKHNSQKGVR